MADLNATQRVKLEEMIALLGTGTDLAVGERLDVNSYVIGGLRKILGVPVFGRQPDRDAQQREGQRYG